MLGLIARLFIPVSVLNRVYVEHISVYLPALYIFLICNKMWLTMMGLFVFYNFSSKQWVFWIPGGLFIIQKKLNAGTIFSQKKLQKTRESNNMKF